MKKPFISNTIRTIAIWNAAVMFGLYATFSLFTLFILNYELIDDLDTKLRHELDHILNTVKITSDSLIVLSPVELEENEFQEVSEESYFLQIYNLSGVLYLRSDNLNDYEELLLGFPDTFTPYFYESFNTSSDELRTIYKELFDDNNNHVGYIQLSAIHSSFNQVIKNVFWFNVFTLPFVLLTIIYLSIFLAKKSYEPINKIIKLADNISATHLTERLEYVAMPNDELGKLKSTLNSLFERLENQINQISHFTDNASHQLMTPLTSLKTELDFILKKDRTTEDYKETCYILKDQTDKMIVLIKTMLLLAKDYKEYTGSTNVFDLSKLLKDEVLNSFKHQNVKFEIEDNIYLRGKSEYFSIVMQNLINNALKYSLNKKEVIVKAKSSEETVIISVSDHGIGIIDEEKKKIFDRFYRVENNTQGIDGYGLGLSLVKSVSKSMGGKIEIKDNNPNGSIFIISLPTIKLN